MVVQTATSDVASCLEGFSVSHTSLFTWNSLFCGRIYRKILAVTMKSFLMFSCVLISVYLCFLPFTYLVNSSYFWLVFSLILVHNSILALFSVLEIINTSKEPLLSWRARTKDSTAFTNMVYLRRTAVRCRQGSFSWSKVFPHVTAFTVAKSPPLAAQKSWLSVESMMSISTACSPLWDCH